MEFGALYLNWPTAESKWRSVTFGPRTGCVRASKTTSPFESSSSNRIGVNEVPRDPATPSLSETECQQSLELAGTRARSAMIPTAVVCG